MAPMTPYRAGAAQRRYRRLRVAGSLIAVLAAFDASHAGASGRLKPPETRETLRSAAACLTALRTRAGDDARKARRETIAPDGSRRAVTVEVKVPLPRRGAPGVARYTARIWNATGWPQPTAAS
jgi:hypothetical protein